MLTNQLLCRTIDLQIKQPLHFEYLGARAKRTVPNPHRRMAWRKHRPSVLFLLQRRECPCFLRFCTGFGIRLHSGAGGMRISPGRKRACRSGSKRQRWRSLGIFRRFPRIVGAVSDFVLQKRMKITVDKGSFHEYHRDRGSVFSALSKIPNKLLSAVVSA